MDNSLNLVCQTFTGYDIPEEVLQNIKKFMIVPKLDNIFNKNYETIWRCIELLEIKYNHKHYPDKFPDSDIDRKFPIRDWRFKKLVQLTDGSGGDSSISRYSNYHYTYSDRLDWYVEHFRNRFLFELLYNLPTMTNNDKFIVSWFKEDIDKDIISLKNPEIGKELTRFLEERHKRLEKDIYKGYCHDYAYGCRKINNSKPDCWRFQNISKNPDRDSYYTQSGQLKKNKKIQKQYLDSVLASRERLGGIDYQHYNHKGGFVPNTWDNETFNKKVGREWLLEDKLDTKTLLRIYGGVRPTYEDSVKKSLDSMKR